MAVSDLALSVAFADRVTGVLSIFLERLDRPFHTDTLDPRQGVALMLDDAADDLDRLTRIAGLALRVAVELDREPAIPPPGERSWAAFELRSQAGLVDLLTGAPESLSPEVVDELRTEAGGQSQLGRVESTVTATPCSSATRPGRPLTVRSTIARPGTGPARSVKKRATCSAPSIGPGTADGHGVQGDPVGRVRGMAAALRAGTS